MDHVQAEMTLTWHDVWHRHCGPRAHSFLCCNVLFPYCYVHIDVILHNNLSFLTAFVNAQERADVTVCTKDTVQSSLESSQAVTQLLNVASDHHRDEEQQSMRASWQQTVHLEPRDTGPPVATVQNAGMPHPLGLCSTPLTAEDRVVEARSEDGIKEVGPGNHQPSNDNNATMNNSHGVKTTRPASRFVSCNNKKNIYQSLDLI